MSRYRYPGVNSFELTDRPIFFGRDRDIAELTDLILLEKLVVVFGKSGFGKSSLLKAGVMPRLLESPTEPAYQPIYVRMGLYVEGQETSPVENIRRRLRETATPDPAGHFLEEEPGLWSFFRRHQTNRTRHFVLIFDQFEEFFSYPEAEQLEFKEELSELLYTTIPQNLRDRLDQLGESEWAYLTQDQEVKAVFVIRSDRLSDLDTLRDRLSAILYKRYELKGLTPDQARQAIVQPARLPQSSEPPFVSPTFTYTPEAIGVILRELSSSEEQKEKGVEAFQLQILCQHIENQIIRKAIKTRDDEGHPTVLPEDLPNIAGIYEDYYRHRLDEFQPEDQEAVHKLIEEGLIFEDQKTGEARRLSMDVDLLVQRFASVGATHALLQRLEDTFLLRRESNSLGRFNYELSHDTLVAPVLKAKTERLEIERRALEEAQERERRQQLQNLQAQAEQERQLRERAEENERLAQVARAKARSRFRIAIVVSVFAIALAVFAIAQYRQTQQALEALRQEQAEKDRKDYDQLLQRGKDLEETGYYREALELYRQAETLVARHQSMEAFRDQEAIIQQRIKQIEDED